MKHYMRAILVFITAFIMLMSTGTSVFAADGASIDGSAEPETQTAASDAEKADDSESSDVDDSETPALGEIKYGLSAKQISNDSVSLEWNVEDGKTYDIQYFKKTESGTETETPRVIEDVTLNENGVYLVTGLKSWTEYVFKIREHPADGDADFVEEATCTVLPTAIEPKSYASFKSVVLEWEPVEGATGYLVQRGSTSSDFSDLKLVSSSVKNSYYVEENGVCRFTTTSGFEKDRYYDKVRTGYYYRIRAVKFDVEAGVTLTESEANAKLASEDCMVSEPSSASKKSYCVRTMFYKVYPKMNRKLTSKNVVNGKRKTKTFKKTQPLYCYGYSAGCYYFMDGDYRFRISRINARKQSVYYHKQGTENYSYKEAELFVNRYMQKGGMSKPTQTGYCIWVSFYDQHSYILQYRNGKWQMAQKGLKPTVGSAKSKAWKWSTTNWESSTGKASTPSYTGNQRINSYRVKYLKGIYWWNGYLGKNGYHGKRSSYPLGKPASHGCIRNATDNAKKIWDMKFIGTPVICY